MGRGRSLSFVLTAMAAGGQASIACTAVCSAIGVLLALTVVRRSSHVIALSGLQIKLHSHVESL